MAKQPFDQMLVRRSGRVWRRQGGLPLCEVCGQHEGCDLRAALSTLGAARRATVMVSECGAFMPVVGFQDTTGLDREEFNTFRRGRGWANRVFAGCRVALCDIGAGRLIGTAVVTDVHVAPLGELLGQHAATNHLMLAVEEARAPEELHRVLRRLYGTTYAAASQEFSVIALRRERDDRTRDRQGN